MEDFTRIAHQFQEGNCTEPGFKQDERVKMLCESSLLDFLLPDFQSSLLAKPIFKYTYLETTKPIHISDKVLRLSF